MHTLEQPVIRLRRDQCFFCTRRHCNFRVYTVAGDFDEIACFEHIRNLEQYADVKLGSQKRWHHTSSFKVTRAA
jgi:hypothetical protein